eukprot:scaffold270607_cov36-Tisochrysis_lutea.AAC.3
MVLDWPLRTGLSMKPETDETIHKGRGANPTYSCHGCEKTYTVGTSAASREKVERKRPSSSRSIARVNFVAEAVGRAGRPTSWSIGRFVSDQSETILWNGP